MNICVHLVSRAFPAVSHVSTVCPNGWTMDYFGNVLYEWSVRVIFGRMDFRVDLIGAACANYVENSNDSFGQFSVSGELFRNISNEFFFFETNLNLKLIHI